jgi:drug/metabolite transporter (DMT)-like permease
MVLLAGLFNVISLYLTNFAFQRVQTTLASNILALESLFGILIGFLIYSEILSLKEFVGGAVIIVSAILMNNLHKNNV